jgi:hypothetical protein
VYGRVADGEGDGREMSVGYGNGSVSDAGEGGIETEAVAGVPV